MLVKSLPPTPSRRTPLHIQRAVLLALVIRELRVRVEGRWLGLIWMLFEPLAHVTLVMALVGFRSHAISSIVDFPVFLVTGILPFFMFRNLTRRVPNAVNSSRGLFSYRQVKPIDAIIARCIVEIGLYSAVYFCALALLGWLGYHFLPHQPLELMAISIVLLGLGSGLGILFSVLLHGRPKVQAVISWIFYPLYFASGVIIPLQNLSPQVKSWLLWNPVLHLIELSRKYFIPNYDTLDGVGWVYPSMFSLVVVTMSLSLYRVYRHRLVSAE